MDLVQLQRQFVDYRTSLYHEGYLDEQFTQLQELQDENNPDFVVEVVSLFFEDSQRLLNELTNALENQNIDFKRVDAHVHQLKGSSSSIGAQRVRKSCVAFRNYCEEQNVEGCVECVQQVKHEYSLVKTKLEYMFQLEQQILNAGGSIPVLSTFELKLFVSYLRCMNNDKHALIFEADLENAIVIARKILFISLARVRAGVTSMVLHSLLQTGFFN